MKAAPFILAWELTKACNLDCRHCRASARPERDAHELSTSEGLALLDELSTLGTRMVILSGGEPLLRPDVLDFARHGTARGLRMTLATNGALVDDACAASLKDAGIVRVSISLDGATPAVHDAFRGRQGAFELALAGIEALKRAGLPVQVNTTVAAANLSQMERFPKLVEDLGAVAWHVFFLVPTGRGHDLEAARRQEYRSMLNDFLRVYQGATLECKATCAPQFYRLLRETGIPPSTRGCLAGSGFGFVSATGDVQPCGFLQVACGNIRQARFGEIWRNSPFLRSLRNDEELQGKCGACAHRDVCGGCRARAYEVLGDALGPDPICWYPNP